MKTARETKWRRMGGACVAAIALVAALSAQGCSNFLSWLNPGVRTATLTVSLSLPSAKTVAANEADFAAAISTISISIVDESSTTVASASDIAYGGFSARSFSSLNAGAYTVKANAYDAAGALIASGSSATTLTAQASASATVALTFSRSASSGGFSLRIRWPSTTEPALPYVHALVDGSGSPIDLSAPASDGLYSGVLARSGLSGGRHKLFIYFRSSSSSTTNYGLYVESLNIWDGVTSTRWIDSKGELLDERLFASGDFLDANASLGNLAIYLDGSSTDVMTGFSSGTTSYTLGAAALASLSFAPTASIEGQALDYSWNGGEWVAIGSGSDSASLSLASDSNDLRIRVTAKDRVTTRTYAITALKAGSGSIGFSLDLERKAIVFTDSELSLTLGKSATFSCSDADLASTSGWSWSVNGVAVAGQVSSSFSFAPSALGRYSICCSVTYGGIGYSGSATVTAVEPTSLSYDGNGNTGGLAPSGSAYTAGQTVLVAANTGGLVKSGFRFSGWNKAADGSGETYAPGSSFAMPGASLILYAVWTNEVPSDVGAISSLIGFGSVTFSWTDPSEADFSYIQIGYDDGAPKTLKIARGSQHAVIAGLSSAAVGCYAFTFTTYDSGGLASTGVASTVAPWCAAPLALTSSSTVSTLAASAAPTGLATDGTYLYVAETGNNMIRKIRIDSGLVSTLAGSTSSGSTDGAGEAASFAGPTGLATDGESLYVADTGNNMIRRIRLSTGQTTTLAGTTTSGYANGSGSAARFNGPSGLATDGRRLYVADSGNNAIRAIVIATGAVSNLAGSGAAGSSDGTGAAASFNNPGGLATDGSYLYVADTDNNKIRKVELSGGAVTTLAGSLSPSAYDGVGSKTGFNLPRALVTDGSSLYIADGDNDSIRKLVIRTRATTTLTGEVAGLDDPRGLATDGRTLFIADRLNNAIRRISP